MVNGRQQRRMQLEDGPPTETPEGAVRMQGDCRLWACGDVVKLLKPMRISRVNFDGTVSVWFMVQGMQHRLTFDAKELRNMTVENEAIARAIPLTRN